MTVFKMMDQFKGLVKKSFNARRLRMDPRAWLRA